MAKRETDVDPYAPPKPPRDHTGFFVRAGVIAVIVGGLAFTGYLMSNTEPQQQYASLQPSQMQQAENTAAPPPAVAPARAAEESVTAPAPAPRASPLQQMPAEPMVANTPPALPPAADPAVAIPEIQPSSP
jgi:uncharacterized iron-regulated membrane protein